MWSTESRRLQLLLPLLLAVCVEGKSGKNATVSWLSPSNGDTFSSGDKIRVKWKAAAAVISPSFRLCLSSTGVSARDDSDVCGAAAWPIVKNNSDSYSTSLTIPDVHSKGVYFFRMSDDFGSTSESPCFHLLPSSTFVADVVNEGPPVHVEDQPQSPFVSVKPHTKTSILPPKTPDHLANESISSGPSSTNPAMSASTSHTTSANSSSNADPHALMSHRPLPSAVGFAIPLSIAGAILVLVAVFAFRYRLKLRRERKKDPEQPSVSRQSSRRSLKSIGDVESMLNVLPKEGHDYTPQVPVPLFMPVEPLQIPRRSSRKPIPPSSAYTTPPVCNSVRVSRHLSTRSVYSQASAYLPPITPSSRGLFDEERANPATHSVIATYFQPSPIISPSYPVPSPPPKVYTPEDSAGLSMSREVSQRKDIGADGLH